MLDESVLNTVDSRSELCVLVFIFYLECNILLLDLIAFLLDIPILSFKLADSRSELCVLAFVPYFVRKLLLSNLVAFSLDIPILFLKLGYLPHSSLVVSLESVIVVFEQPSFVG